MIWDCVLSFNDHFRRNDMVMLFSNVVEAAIAAKDVTSLSELQYICEINNISEEDEILFTQVLNSIQGL